LWLVHHFIEGKRSRNDVSADPPEWLPDTDDDELPAGELHPR
jgi:hypothetical protein